MIYYRSERWQGHLKREERQDRASCRHFCYPAGRRRLPSGSSREAAFPRGPPRLCCLRPPLFPPPQTCPHRWGPGLSLCHRARQGVEGPLGPGGLCAWHSSPHPVARVEGRKMSPQSLEDLFFLPQSGHAKVPGLGIQPAPPQQN